MFNYSVFMICDSEKKAKEIQVLDMSAEKFERLFN